MQVRIPVMQSRLCHSERITGVCTMQDGWQWSDVELFLPFQVRIDFRTSWQRDTADGGLCDDSDIANEDLLGPSAAWDCLSGNCGQTAIGTMQYVCTSFSVENNWSHGGRSIEFNFPLSSRRFFFGSVSFDGIESRDSSTLASLFSAATTRTDHRAVVGSEGWSIRMAHEISDSTLKSIWNYDRTTGRSTQAPSQTPYPFFVLVEDVSTKS